MIKVRNSRDLSVTDNPFHNHGNFEKVWKIQWR